MDATTSAAEFEALLLQQAESLVSDLMQPSYLALARIVVAETPRDPSLADLFRTAVAARALGAISAAVHAGGEHCLVDRGVDIGRAARALVGPLLTYVLLDGLLRAPDDIRRPSPDAVRGQVILFCRSIRPRHPQPRDQETS
ncbi:TetR/AcrR family transcriptional regulator C-terminal domain-containing protein [Pseudonocardia sp. GCM10023141]